MTTHGAGEPSSTVVMVIRAWVQRGQLLARIVGPGGSDQSPAVATSAEELCALLVRRLGEALPALHEQERNQEDEQEEGRAGGL